MSASAVPRVVHQIWWQGREKMPKKFEANLDVWRRLHPDWTFRFWDGPAIREATRAEFPELVKLLEDDNTQLKIVEKCDVGRMLVLASQGGVYSDLDYVPKKHQGHLLRMLDDHPTADCAMPREMTAHNNCWAIAKSQSKFLREYYLPLISDRIASLQSRMSPVGAVGKVMPIFETFWKTGPDAVEDARRSCRCASERFLSMPRAVIMEEFGEHTMDASWAGGWNDFQRDAINGLFDGYEQAESTATTFRRHYVRASKSQPIARIVWMLGLGSLLGVAVPWERRWTAVLFAIVALLLLHTYDRMIFALEGTPVNRMPAIVPLAVGLGIGAGLQFVGQSSCQLV